MAGALNSQDTPQLHRYRYRYRVRYSGRFDSDPDSDTDTDGDRQCYMRLPWAKEYKILTSHLAGIIKPVFFVDLEPMTTTDS